MFVHCLSIKRSRDICSTKTFVQSLIKCSYNICLIWAFFSFCFLLVVLQSKSKDLSKKRDMNSIISKLEQDDKMLAELDSKLRSVSRRTLVDDDELCESTEKSTSLPSLNTGIGDWRLANTDTVVSIAAAEQSDPYRKGEWRTCVHLQPFDDINLSSITTPFSS